MKACKICKVDKDESEFRVMKKPNNRTCLNSYCKQCEATINKERQKTEKGKAARNRYQVKYFRRKAILAKVGEKAIKLGLLPEPKELSELK